MVNNNLIVMKGQRHAKMTELNHLGLNLNVKPAELEPHVNQMFSATEYYSNNALLTKLYGKEKTINATEWTWKLRNADTRPLTCLGNVEPNTGQATVGAKGQPFYLWLDEDWLSPGDNIHPGSSSVKFNIRIVEAGIPKEKGYIYKARMNNPKASLPVSFLKLGQRFGKLFSNYEEGAEQSGSIVFGNDVMFKNSMSLLRKKYRITNFASTATLSTKIMTKEGPKNSWISYAEAEFFRQWQREKEMLIWYGQTVTDVAGSTGRPILGGPGVQEMLQDGHVHKTSQLTARLIEEYIMDIMYSRTNLAKGQKLTAYTGYYGMLNFHRCFDDVWSKKGMRILAGNFEPVQKTDSEVHSNSYSYGYQFTKFKMFNGQELELVHLPIYDDRSVHFEIDPITGYPLESQRLTFLDFAENQDGNMNVQLMKKENGFAFNYVNGLYSPTGPTPKNMAAHEGSWYTMIIEDTLGVHIDDVTKCGEIIISRA